MSIEKSNSDTPKKKRRMGNKTAFGLGLATGLVGGAVITLVAQDLIAEQAAETEPSASGSKATGT